jgi:hypothetical protein
VRATTNELLFYNLGVGTATPPTGEFSTVVPGTGNFAPITGIDPPGTDATILDLTGVSPDPLCVGCGFAPVNTPLTVMNFIVFPTISIELTGITAPSAPLCSSLSSAALASVCTDCTPNATSTLLLTNNLNVASGAIDTSVAISGAGLAWFDATPGQISTASISLTSTFVSENILQVLNTFNSQGFVDNGLAGQVTITGSSTPEPGTLSMMLGSGLLAFGLVLRRRRS